MEDVIRNKDSDESYPQSCNTKLSMLVSEILSPDGSMKAGASLPFSHLGASVQLAEELVGSINYPIMNFQKEIFSEPDSDDEESESSMGSLGLAFTEGLSFEHGEPFETSERDLFLGGVPSPKDIKNKKKKKSRRGPQSLHSILALNATELEKLEESRAGNTRSLMATTLVKNAKFPGPASGATEAKSSLDITDSGLSREEESGDSQNSDQYSMCCPSSVYTLMHMRSNSLPTKSSLRGGHEEVGLGPRPKLHVKWAPDVLDPACSSISHTVNHGHGFHHLKKRQHKHRRKGKSSHDNACKKHEKKHSHKLRYTNYEGVLREQVNFSHCAMHKEDLRGLVAIEECLVLPHEEIDETFATCKDELQELVSSGSHGWSPVERNKVSKTESERIVEIAISGAEAVYVHSAYMDLNILQELKCSKSLMGGGNLQCKLLCGEAT